MNKKYIGIIAVIIILIGVIYAIQHQGQIQEKTIAVSNNNVVTPVEKKIICKAGAEVETEWCTLPTNDNQKVMLNQSGDELYDEGDHYTFYRDNHSVGVYIYKDYKDTVFTCSDHPEASSCNNTFELVLANPVSKDFYDEKLQMFKDIYSDLNINDFP